MNQPNSILGHKTTCFHCGLAADSSLSASINGEQRYFCCFACQSVCQAISAGGLADYYRFRDQINVRPDQGKERFEAYDNSDLQFDFVSDLTSGEKRVLLNVGGVRCAACAWLIENHLQQLSGVSRVRVNVASHRLSFDWSLEQIKLSQIFLALHRIGYKPMPSNNDQNTAYRKQEKRSALLRLGVAGLGMMQVGMVGITLHAGALQGMEDHWQHYLRWISLIFAVPVIVFSAQTFFVGAWRSLMMRHLSMDVPVALALGLAFLASISATLSNHGEVYFDSISMFTFFLLIGRFLEMSIRHHSAKEIEQLNQILPRSVERVIEGDINQREWLPLNAIKPGQIIYVSAGEVIPCDGTLNTELAMVDEALLTGESELQERHQGQLLLAGSILGEPSASITVTATGSDTRLAGVQRLLDEALSQKPKQQCMADKVASYFVAAVLVCCAMVYGVWYFIDSQRAFWIALSVLVVTCPCALSLATPAALASGLSKLRKMGLLLISPWALETLPQVTHIVFDKTGTLTTGEPSVHEVRCLADINQQQILEMLAAIEAHSLHPLARAFTGISTQYKASAVKAFPGKGIEANLQGAALAETSQRYRFGRADFACPDNTPAYPSDASWQLLSVGGRALAWVNFVDLPRAGLAQLQEYLLSHAIKASIFSGDRQENVHAFVQQNLPRVAFHRVLAQLSPEQKLHELKALQRDDVVLMMGDGINDVPVLAAADLSVAMGSASQLAKVNADSILLAKSIVCVPEAIGFSHKVKQIIRQNFAWAIGYNLIALPAAMMGLIPPWLAAIGMSMSSLVVVINSLRLKR